MPTHYSKVRSIKEVISLEKGKLFIQIDNLKKEIIVMESEMVISKKYVVMVKFLKKNMSLEYKMDYKLMIHTGMYYLVFIKMERKMDLTL